MVPVWPIKVLTPRTGTIKLAFRSLRGSANLRGGSQSVTSDSGLWAANYSEFPVLSRNNVLAWRSLSELSAGSANPIDVPLFCYEGAYQPGGNISPFGLFETLRPVPHSDASSFSDGSKYVSQYAKVSVASFASLRSNSLDLTLADYVSVEPGQHFSIEHPNKGPRLYRIRTASKQGGGAVTVSFSPVLREAVTVGTRVEFDRPVCRMRLASDDAMDLELSSGVPVGFPAVSFIEDF